MCEAHFTLSHKASFNANSEIYASIFSREGGGHCTQATAYLIDRDIAEVEPHPFTPNVALDRTPRANECWHIDGRERVGAVQL